MTVKACVVTGHGINCDYETQRAFELAGAQAERVHLNDLLTGEKKLADFQILAVPGGFSFGDDLGSGKVFAAKLKTYLADELLTFVEAGKPAIGICNGAQIFVKSGLLPDGIEHSQQVTLTYNDSGRFECRWVYVRPVDDCIWTKGIEVIPLPVAHGEGKFMADPETLSKLHKNQQIVFAYCDSTGNVPNAGYYPLNPNGSIDNIAGICDPTGLIFALMPHPERFLDATNHPQWTREREHLKREGKELPEEGLGRKIFQNAVDYVRVNV